MTACVHQLTTGHSKLQKEEAAIQAVKKGMGVLEKHLHSRTFLVGHTATLADIVGVCNLYFGYTKVLSNSATHACCAGYCRPRLHASCPAVSAHKTLCQTS